MKRNVTKILGIICGLILVISWVLSVLCILNPYWKGTIVSKDTYTILYNPDMNAYSLEYLRKPNEEYTDLQVATHKIYKNIEPLRHYVVVEYPSFMTIGRTIYGSKERELVWVDDAFRGDVGQEIIFNQDTHEMIIDNVNVIPNGLKWVSIFWVGFWVVFFLYLPVAILCDRLKR